MMRLRALLLGFLCCATRAFAEPVAAQEALPIAIDAGEHSAEVLALATHAAGLTLVSAAADGTVRVWDLATGRCAEVLRLPALSRVPGRPPGPATGAAVPLALSSDGEVVAVATPAAEPERSDLILVTPGAAGRRPP